MLTMNDLCKWWHLAKRLSQAQKKGIQLLGSKGKENDVHDNDSEDNEKLWSDSHPGQQKDPPPSLSPS